MFQNVLVGVHGRPNSPDAIALALRLMDSRGQLTLAHVHPGALRPSRAVTPGMVAEECEASERLLEEARAAAGVTARLESVVALSPSRGLHEQAELQAADLIVVGSCRRGVIGRIFVGDDARGALSGARCAVAVAALGYAEHPRPIARIGVGYDETPESRLALEAARRLAPPTGASVHALHVVQRPVYDYAWALPTGTTDVTKEVVDAARGRMSELTGVTGDAVAGLSGEELAAFSDDVDLLVVGSRGYGPFGRLVFGSTSHYLERHARCSLLVLPRGAQVPSPGGSPARSESDEQAAVST